MHTKSPVRYLAVGLATVLTLSGCSALKGDPVESGFADPSADPPTEIAFTDDVEVVDPLIDYDVVDVAADSPAPEVFEFSARGAFDDVPVAGTDLYRTGPMIIAFVTPSCPVCSVEGPKLANSANLNPDINYIVVHSSGSTDQYADFVAATELNGDNITHLVDGDTSLWAHFGVIAQPSYVLVNSEGHLSASVGALQDHGLARAADLITNQI